MTFSDQEITTMRRTHGYRPVGRTGSHRRRRWGSPDTDEVRLATVPMVGEDEIPTGTLRSIADQWGAEDFQN